MRIKKIAAICKKSKCVVIFNKYNDDGEIIAQYIGDGCATYPITRLPELDEESILTIFDVPEVQRSEWNVKITSVPKEINLSDVDTSEHIIKQDNTFIIYAGKTLKPLQTHRGIVFIDNLYCSPVSDAQDVVEFYDRPAPGGIPYIVIKAGFCFQAAIMPYDVINERFVYRLQELARQCSLYLDLHQQTKAKTEDAEQIMVNLQTGEVTEESEG